MRWLIDAIYLAVAIITSPIWLVRMIRTGKIKTDWAGRFGCAHVTPATGQNRILLHAVSVGEVNAIRILVERLAQLNEPPEIVIAATTNTGWASNQIYYKN